MQISDIFAFVPVSTSTQISRVGAGEISLVWKPESFNNSFNRWVSVLVLTLTSDFYSAISYKVTYAGCYYKEAEYLSSTYLYFVLMVLSFLLESHHHD